MFVQTSKTVKVIDVDASERSRTTFY